MSKKLSKCDSTGEFSLTNAKFLIQLLRPIATEHTVDVEKPSVAHFLTIFSIFKHFVEIPLYARSSRKIDLKQS